MVVDLRKEVSRRGKTATIAPRKMTVKKKKKMVKFGDNVQFRGAAHAGRKTITTESILHEVNEFAVPFEQQKSLRSNDERPFRYR